MADTLKLSILSPERRLVQSFAVESVTLTTSEGQIQILPGHAAMIGALETGTFHYEAPGKGQTLGVISTGFFEVRNDEVTVMAETLELQTEIDMTRARSAQSKAESALQSPELDEHQFRKYQLKLQRSLIRQQVASKEH